MIFVFFFFSASAPTEIYTLSLHDALPISNAAPRPNMRVCGSFRPMGGARGNGRLSWLHCGGLIWPHLPSDQAATVEPTQTRSEEHTSELQSPVHLVCRLLLEKKKNYRTTP